MSFLECAILNSLGERLNDTSLCRSVCRRGKEESMSESPKYRILIVDDDPSVPATVARLLADEGYEVSTARKTASTRFCRLKSKVPDVIVSDLNMPQMSGFEFLSVVRRRFPKVLVIAMSGAYKAGDAVPGGIIANAFYGKGSDSPPTLLRLVADLLQTSAARAIAHTRQSAPVRVLRKAKTQEAYLTSC
jgi:CheY-like chemotaxis protein